MDTRICDQRAASYIDGVNALQVNNSVVCDLLTAADIDVTCVSEVYESGVRDALARVDNDCMGVSKVDESGIHQRFYNFALAKDGGMRNVHRRNMIV